MDLTQNKVNYLIKKILIIQTKTQNFEDVISGYYQSILIGLFLKHDFEMSAKHIAYKND